MCYTAEVTLHVLRPVFEDRIISRKTDVVWPPRNCDLTPLDEFLWGADKPEKIDDLNYNTSIRGAIGEIQLNTIDNDLKNYTDRVGYCIASRDSQLNAIIFHY